MIITQTIKKICSLLGLMLAIETSLFCQYGNIFFTTDGTNVTNYLPLGTEPTPFFWSVAQSGNYLMWSDMSWQLPTQYGTIQFNAIATNDITIGIGTIDPWSVLTSGVNLYATMTNSTNLYELVIGGWGNSQSAIRQGAQTDPVAVVPTGIPIDPNTSQPFQQLIQYKIILYPDAHNNRDAVAIYLFNPNTESWEQLIKYNGSKFAAGPRYVAFSSWDTNIFYSNIQVSNSTRLPV